MWLKLSDQPIKHKKNFVGKGGNACLAKGHSSENSSASSKVQT